MLNSPARHAQIDAFLEQHLSNAYERTALAADASFRRYERIKTQGGPFVLMDAPPPLEDVRPFMRVTQRLRSIDLHAAQIYAADAEAGLLLLEDFGSHGFRTYLEEKPQDEWLLYRLAIDVLLHLHRFPPSLSDIAPYDHAAYRRELEIFTDWYLPDDFKLGEKERFLAIWDATLADVGPLQSHLVLRDYHADNLMWLPDAANLQRAGLLDYQDALIGDPAYDLVSLIEDARRDVSAQTTADALDYYIKHSGEDPEHFWARYALLGAQRNLKIIGIFNRLNRRDGKTHYLTLLPRVWEHLRTDLQHPCLFDIRQWCEQHCGEYLR